MLLSPWMIAMEDLHKPPINAKHHQTMSRMKAFRTAALALYDYQKTKYEKVEVLYAHFDDDWKIYREPLVYFWGNLKLSYCAYQVFLGNNFVESFDVALRGHSYLFFKFMHNLDLPKQLGNFENDTLQFQRNLVCLPLSHHCEGGQFLRECMLLKNHIITRAAQLRIDPDRYIERKNNKFKERRKIWLDTFSNNDIKIMALLFNRPISYGTLAKKLYRNHNKVEFK